MLLSACDPVQTTRLISPAIPAELLVPVPEPTRQATTLKDLGLLVVDYDQALEQANSKIEATGAIIAKFNQRISNAE